MKNNQANITFQDTTNANDLSIIQEVTDKHSVIKKCLKRRLNNLKAISSAWQDSKLISTLHAISLYLYL